MHGRHGGSGYSSPATHPNPAFGKGDTEPNTLVSPPSQFFPLASTQVVFSSRGSVNPSLVAGMRVQSCWLSPQGVKIGISTFLPHGVSSIGMVGMTQFPLDEPGKTSLASICEAAQSRHDYRSRNMDLFLRGRKRKKGDF